MKKFNEDDYKFFVELYNRCKIAGIRAKDLVYFMIQMNVDQQQGQAIACLAEGRISMQEALNVQPGTGAIMLN